MKIREFLVHKDEQGLFVCLEGEDVNSPDAVQFFKIQKDGIWAFMTLEAMKQMGSLDTDAFKQVIGYAAQEQTEYININIPSKLYHLPTKDGICVRTNKAEFEEGVDKAVSESPQYRLAMIASLRKEIKKGLKFMDQNPSKAGKCEQWENLMDDCVLLATYEFAHNGVPVRLMADSRFDTSILNVDQMVDPVLYSIHH